MTNVLVFISGFSIFVYGLYQVGPQWAYIVGGLVLMAAVATDVGLKATGVTKDRK